MVQSLGFNRESSNAAWLLLAGIIALAISHETYGIGFAAWVSNLPFLLYLARTQGWKSRLAFFAALLIAWTAATAKIVTAPIPYALTLLYAAPIALIHLPGYLIWARFRTQRGAFLLFPAILTLMEWLQYTFTPFASWGVAAYTQADNLPLMQSLSLFGMPGLSFLIYWINVSLTEVVLKKERSPGTFHAPIVTTLLLLIFGTLRLAIFNANGRDTITLAAVGTDSKVSGLPLATAEENEKFKATLFARTRTAAGAGAKLVVWNEAALAILPEEESILKDSLAKISREQSVSLVAAYVVAISKSPLLYENKFLHFDDAGNMLKAYQKHQPVPGEPALKGNEPLQVENLENTLIGGAICYDYDFPYLARGFGKLNADIIALPSSDWRGIDPIHSKMAAFRAVEQGHSILRSTRFGLSAGINPCGEMVARMSSFDQNDKIMLASLPRSAVRTFYRWTGDWVIGANIAFLLWFFYCYYKNLSLSSHVS